MTKAVIYARGTTDKIDKQIYKCVLFAKLMDYEIVDIYVDKTSLSRVEDRPRFYQVIEDSKTGVFDRIIVTTPDIISRNHVDYESYITYFKENNIKLEHAMNTQMLDMILEDNEPHSLSNENNIMSAESPSYILIESIMKSMIKYFMEL